MVEPITNGGPLVWLLLVLSIVALAVFVERLFYYHRASVDVADLLEGLRALIRRGKHDEALKESAATPGPAARVLYDAIRRHDAPLDELRQVVQASGQLEVPRIERYLSVLSTVAYTAPLIGLLGTIMGLFETFSTIAEIRGDPTASDISRGVYQSLVTSGIGLAIAIPAHLLHSYLASHARGLVHDIERAGIEIVNIIWDARREQDIIDFESASGEGKELGEEAGDPGRASSQG